MNRKLAFSMWIILAALLSACSGSGPKQIAAAPKGGPIAVAPRPPQSIIIVYQAYMEFKVSDVDEAAGSATDLVYRYGGYLSASNSWYTDGRKVASLELAVPTTNFEGLRQSLRGLGDLVSESVSGEAIQNGYGGAQYYSTITVQLRPGGLSLPPIDTGGWDPGRTAQNAFDVFLSIFGFLADIIIWLVIVIGPFLAIGLAAGFIIRRMRRSV